jgi:formylglycine-generating enzyme required for sulfatase activity
MADYPVKFPNKLLLGSVLTAMKGATMRSFVLGMALIGIQFAARADELRVESFSDAGRLSFNEIPTATEYRVESAPAPDGSWAVASNGAAAITFPATGSGSVTCSVPMDVARRFYRVVATVPPPVVPPGLALVPAGINNGTDPDAGAYSLTNVSAIYMDTREVTKALWDAVKDWNDGNGYDYDNGGSGKGTNHPVQGVNWYDCVKWCNARSERDGLTPVYYTDAGFTQIYKSGQIDAPYVKSSATGYRLPTEVEWQYAARGGVAGRRFAWDDADTIQHVRANYCSASVEPPDYDTSATRGFHPDFAPPLAPGDMPYTSPVGTFAPNTFGLCDLTGNVSEWCFDGYTYDGRLYRAMRGGGWVSDAIACRIAERGVASPNSAEDSYGFRTVRKP